MKREQVEDWESRFDELFVSEFGGVMPRHRDGGRILKEELKSFISHLISEKEKEAMLRQRNYDEKLKIEGWNAALEAAEAAVPSERTDEWNLNTRNGPVLYANDKGFNSCRTQTLENLTKLKK